MRPRPVRGYSDEYEGAAPLAVLNLVPRTVLVLQGTGWSPEQAAAIADAVPDDVLVVGLHPGDSITALDEDAMRVAGWVKVPETAGDDDPRDNPIEDFLPGGAWYDAHPEDP